MTERFVIDMDRVDKILKNKEFLGHMEAIAEAETTRRFCLHGFEHSIDVARIGYIINLEEKLGFGKDVVYAMAFLHDLGRSVEYIEGIPHHQAGADMAIGILRDADYTDDEISQIIDAISHHKKYDGEEHNLRYILYRADKLSRNCFVCPSYEECYWSEDMKNKTIIF